MINNGPKYLDLFAGAGGLSEGFIKAGFSPVAHIEIDKSACNTLKTRLAYHWLSKNNGLYEYYNYMSGGISRKNLYNLIPEKLSNSVLSAEINEKTLNSIFNYIDKILNGKKLDIIIGGPPCQAYSLVGRARDTNRMQNDHRNYLYKYYAKFLIKYKPVFFLFENVTGLLSASNINKELYLDKMIKTFTEAGYSIEYKIISANEFGIPQKRKRIFIVGKSGKYTGFFPEPDKWKPQITVNEIFSDLPTLKAGEGFIRGGNFNKYSGTYLYEAEIKNSKVPLTFHIARQHSQQDLEIYRIAVDLFIKGKKLNYNELPERLKSHKNRKSFTDRFRVVDGKACCSHTIVAHIAKDGHYFIHPDIKQNRSLTPREAARLQTFPDNYFFESISDKPGYTSAFRQIGNAVPVLLARKIAEKLKEIW